MAWIEGRLSTRGTGSGAITVAAALGALAACWALVGRVKSKSEKTVSFTLANLQTLRGFELREILKDEDDGRVTTLLGRFTWQKEDEMALVKLTATPLSLQGLQENLHRLRLGLKSESGAEYAFFDCSISPWRSFLHDLKAHSYSLEVVAPASERTISRNRPIKTVMVTETAMMHAAVTAPHIDSIISDGKALAWLFNVLSKDKESERVLYEDDDEEDGFLMNVDTKWRTHPNMSLVPRGEWYAHPSVTDLYCLVISHRRGIRTIRDLRATHIPMLKEIYWRGIETIRTVYGVPEDQLRVYVHYLPQFFHFHVHFTRLHNTVGVETERAHLLQDIIQNLEIDSEYYRKRTMQFRVRENDALRQALDR